MEIGEIVICFLLIACMRVAQSFSGKGASNLVNNKGLFFQYGAFYQAVSAIASLATLIIVGFNGFNLPTLICSFINALLFATSLYCSLTAMKSAKMIVCSMFSMGGIVIPCIVGIFLFNEPMSLQKWIAIAIFLFAVFLLNLKGKNEENKKMKPTTWVLLVLLFTVEGLVLIVQKYFAILVPNGNVATFSFLTFSLNAIILSLASVVNAFLNAKNNEEGQSSSTKLLKFEKLPLPLFLYGTLLGIAIFVINFLVTTLSKTIPSAQLFPISCAISIAVTTIVSMLRFKEKLNWKNIVGIIIGLVSIIMLNV